MTTAITHEARHALHELVPDPGALPPACDEHEFAVIVEGMVADEAPRLFAVVQEYGERVDAVIAAWGHGLRRPRRDRGASTADECA